MGRIKDKRIYMDDYGCFGSPHDEFDRRNFHWGKEQRTKFTNPYNYDMYTVWASSVGVEGNGSAYSDRIWEWDRAKADAIAKAVWPEKGEKWFSSVDKVETFLQLFFTGGNSGHGNIRLVRMVDGCNQATGYPLFLFIWVDETKPAPPPARKPKLKTPFYPDEFF